MAMRLFLLPVAFCACAVGAVEYSPKNEAELKACLPKLRAGDVVSLLPGKTYYSGMVIRRSGTVTQPIVIKGNGAVLDGLAKIPDDSWVPKGDGLFLSPNKCCHGANHPRVCDKDGNLMRVVNKNVHGVKPETLKSGEAKPQPPQLAPGITFSTCSILGSSSTLNFSATRYRMTASTSPRAAITTIVQIIIEVIILLN